MRIVAALGGNALLRRGEPPDAEVQQRHVAEAAAALAPVARHHELIVTHGNGPQVGLLALESANDPTLTRPYPLDALDAQTQGLIGYWLLEALQNELPDHEVVCVLTRTVVAADDPAFDVPTKFVGVGYDHDQAIALAADRGWSVAADGDLWRRVVASPEPVGIVEVPVIERLLGPKLVLVCAGGGGVPVRSGPDGSRRGVEAVVDKDLTAALLAEQVGADRLLLLTDVDAVVDGWGSEAARPIARAGVGWFRRHGYARGSMGPKVDAACRFVEHTRRSAFIGALEQVESIMEGRAGTEVTATPAEIG